MCESWHICLVASGRLAGWDGLRMRVGEMSDAALIEKRAVASAGLEVKAGLVQVVPGVKGGRVAGLWPGEDGAVVTGAHEGGADLLSADTGRGVQVEDALGEGAAREVSAGRILKMEPGNARRTGAYV